MLTLWALVFMLALQAEALDLLTSPPILEKLPVNKSPLLHKKLLTYPIIPGAPFDTEFLPLPQNGECYPVARYFMSSSKLRDYLNATLIPQIEKMLKCEEVDLAGLLGTVLDAVTDLDLLSVLDITSSLNILGGIGLDGILGKGSSSKSSKLPLSPLLEATGVSNLLSRGHGILHRPVPIGTEDGPDYNPPHVSNLLQPLSAVVNKVGKLIESTEDVLNSVVPDVTKDGLLGGLGNINLKDLLIGLEVQKVTVEDMTSTMTRDGILVQAKTTSYIGGKGLTGPVFNILGFQVEADVTVKIGVSTNTQYANLQVQDKDIEVKQVNLQLLKSVTESLPLRVSLPLDDIVQELLTVDLKENIKHSKSCDIDLSDFTEYKNSTGLFKYHIKILQTSAQGLSILYCIPDLYHGVNRPGFHHKTGASAMGAFFNKTVPIPGSLLPPVPKNANVSITLSRAMVRAVIIHSAKQSSIQMNNLDTHITRTAYSSKPDNKVKGIYWVNVKKDGESFGTGQTKITVSYMCKILEGKLKTDIKIVSFEHSMTPPEAMDEVQEVMSAVMKKFVSTITEFFNQWNIPPGVTSNPLNNANVKLLKWNDLQAAN